MPHRSHKWGREGLNTILPEIIMGASVFADWVTDSQKNLEPFKKVRNSSGRCKERSERWIANRRIRDPYVLWCERRTVGFTAYNRLLDCKTYYSQISMFVSVFGKLSIKCLSTFPILLRPS